MWTKFIDMASGGSEKTKFSVIYIETNKENAIGIFEYIFGVDPDNTTCYCCGQDYSIDEVENIDNRYLLSYNLFIGKSELNNLERLRKKFIND